MRRISLVMLAVLLVAGQPVAAGPVVVISVDGLRPDAIAATDTPVLDALIAAGAYHNRARSVFPYDTMNNHATMVTGRTPADRGILLNTALPGKIDAETIFDIAKRAGLRTGFFAGKTKLGFLAPDGALDVTLLESDMTAMTEAVISALSSDGGLDLAFVHFRHPDSIGHREGWMSDAYLEKVREVDGLVRQIADALGVLGDDPAGTILLTADHGGQGLTHFLPTGPTVDIPWLLVGAEAKVGEALSVRIEQEDLAPTVLALLGLDIPEIMRGRVVVEAFSDAALAAAFFTPANPGAIGCGAGLAPVLFASLAWGVTRFRRAAL